MAKVAEQPNGCWLWTGAIQKSTRRSGLSGGYGLFWNGDKLVLAHQWAYEHWVTELPVDERLGRKVPLDHFRCDTPACVNPEHVRPVTHRENILRGTGVAAANAAKTHCLRNHPYDEANTLVTGKDRERQCRTCARDRSKARYDRRKVLI